MADSLEKELAFVLTDPDKAEALLHGRATYEIEEQKGVDLVQIDKPTSHTESVDYDDPFLKKKYKVELPGTKSEVKERPYVHLRRAS